ncbi:SRPBCC family protein [Streptomyces kunmingensis]|uniref:SRPBCC family protein n=1 Tax=Streptomyces kunmingensis TaxID=68225 RepID=A0ABU6C8K3_9ACTN|nr:SRPBCC family protein [Streptomyces kunmingensis]MEB3960675.1 SRPBCC family protein [Streptomyces kunmingensis]
MSSHPAHVAEYAIPVEAPAGVVYGLLADPLRWPVLFPSYIHVERIDSDGSRELLHLWDMASGRLRALHVRRHLDPRTRTVETERIDPTTRQVTGRGVWRVTPDGDHASVLTLRRELGTFLALGPRAATSTAAQALDAEVRARLDEVRAVAGRWERLDELLMAFSDSVHTTGPPELVYDFLQRIEDWPELVPHIEWTEVGTDVPGVQFVDIDSAAWDGGSTVTSGAVRLCFPAAGYIVHKDVVPPAVLSGHTVQWTLLPDSSGVSVVCTHSVLLREEALGSFLGAGATLTDARHEVRTGLGQAGAELLGLAKWHAESALRRVG